MEIQGKTILITGASGFIGSHIARRLKAEGARVRALVRRPEARTEVEGLGAESLLGELIDTRAHQRAVAGAHAVVHCAGSVTADLQEAMRVNADATGALAAAARTGGCERFVHISSIAAYDLDGREVIDESSPLVTEEKAYSMSKAASEHALRAEMAKGLKAVILRPACVLGAHPKSYWGLIFPQAIRAGKFPVVDEQCLFNYVHIEELVESVVQALRIDAAVGEAFNIVGGHTPWRRYTEAFATGPLPALPREQSLNFMRMRGTVSTEKAQRVLGYAPRRTLDEGLAESRRALGIA